MQSTTSAKPCEMRSLVDRFSLHGRFLPPHIIAMLPETSSLRIPTLQWYASPCPPGWWITEALGEDVATSD